MTEFKRIRMNIFIDENEHPELYVRLASIHNDKVRARTFRQLAHERLILIEGNSKLSPAISNIETNSVKYKEENNETSLSNVAPQLAENSSRNKTIPKLPKNFQQITLV